METARTGATGRRVSGPDRSAVFPQAGVSFLLCAAVLAAALGLSSRLASAVDVRSGELFLDFDFPARQVLLRSDEGVHRASLPADGADRLEVFRRELAEMALVPGTIAPGRLARVDSMASALGRELLGGLAPWLEGSSRWVVRPLEAAPLGALPAPWQSGGKRLVDDVVLRYLPGPKAGDRDEGRLEAPRKDHPPCGLLAVCPYTPGLTPAQDDPDTLLWTLRPLLRTLDTLPRPQIDPSTVRAVCREHPYAIVMVRARPAEAASLFAALPPGPFLIWWVRPPHEDRAHNRPPSSVGRTRTLEQITRLCRSRRPVVADLWPRAASPLAEGAALWIEALRDAPSAADALARARRILKSRHRGNPSTWAGWIAAGETGGPVALQAPGLLQRLFHRKKP